MAACLVQRGKQWYRRIRYSGGDRVGKAFETAYMCIWSSHWRRFGSRWRRSHCRRRPTAREQCDMDELDE